ncbi:MAG: dTDP-4-dehydrorhamnose reductase [Pseudomonadota bacterium]
MRILVIGQSGQVARSLAERGPAVGADIVCRGRPQTDLTDTASIAAALADSPDLVINAAAYTAVDAAESDADAARALNADGPKHLAMACAAADVPLIHLSTDYVFDGTLDRPYREDDPIAPQSVYGRTKADGEAAVLASGARALVVRTAWVYSPFGKNFVKTMLRLGAERDHLRVVGDQHGNPTSALAIADGLLALASQRDAWPKGASLLHLTARGEATWHSFASAVFNAANLTPTVDAIATSDYPTPAQRPQNSRLDCGLLAERFGVQLPPWHDSLPSVVSRILDGTVD